MTSRYEELGGGPVMHDVVERLYDRLLDDEQVAGYFATVDMPRLKRHQVLLLSQLLGGPAQYTGRELAVAHAGLGIASVDYDALSDHLVDVLTDVGAPVGVIDALSLALEDCRKDIIS